MIPSFSLHFNDSIYPGTVVTLTSESGAPSLACASTGGRVLVHDGSSVRQFNFNRPVTSLAAARVPSSSHDLIVVGTRSSVQAFDLAANRDVIFKVS